MAVDYKLSSGRVVIRDVANASYVVAGNNSVSNIAAPTETVASAYVSKVFWSTDGQIVVKRGANTLFNLQNSGSWDFGEAGIVITQDAAAAVNVTHSSANSTIVLELRKSATVEGY